MLQFDKPVKAVQHYSDLKVGDVVYRAWGIWPPFCSDTPKKVTRAPCLFKDHSGYNEDLCSSLADEYVFDLDESLEFSNDFNVGERPYNHNYLFRKVEDASEFVTNIRAAWEADKVALEAEKERIKDNQEFYDSLEYWFTGDH